MTIAVRRIAHARREMVGLLQMPAIDAPEQPAFLFCKPFGQEAVRTSQMFQALANRLSRDGSPVLRFDYHGTGDSPGEGRDQALAGWTDDTLAAMAQLRRDAPGRRLNVFGIALGANLAAAAALRAPAAPAQLLLWEPVLDGRAYLSSLLAAHRRELARELQTPWDYLVKTGREVEPELPGSLIGFEVGAELARELGALDAAPLAELVRRAIPVRCALRTDQRAQIVGIGTAAAWHPSFIESPIDWMSGDASGTAIVPRDILQALLETRASP